MRRISRSGGAQGAAWSGHAGSASPAHGKAIRPGDGTAAAAAAAAPAGGTALSVNLVVARAVGEDRSTEIGYAVGLRPDLGSRVGWGLEAQGGLRNREGHEVLLGLYAEPSNRLTLKLGVGERFGEASGWTIRTGIVLRI